MHVEVSTSRVGRGRQPASLYLMGWVAVAAFGLGYIGVAATRPDLLGTFLPLAEPAQDQLAAGRQSSDVVEELAAMRKWIHELQHELAATKSTVQEQAAQANVVLQRLAAAEERVGAVREVKDTPVKQQLLPKAQTRAQLQGQAQAQAQAAATNASPPTGAPATGLFAGAATSVHTAAAAAGPNAPASGAGNNVRVINPQSAPITTGSVPETGSIPGVPTTKAVQPAVLPRAIEIGSAESLDGLRSQWSEIAGRNGDVLGGTSARYRLSADGRPQPFTLLAGPFDTPADATRACNALKSKGVACRVGGAFAGNAF